MNGVFKEPNWKELTDYLHTLDVRRRRASKGGFATSTHTILVLYVLPPLLGPLPGCHVVIVIGLHRSLSLLRPRKLPDDVTHPREASEDHVAH